MARNTAYTSTENELVVIRFNQPVLGGKFVPAVVEVRCEAITDEGAVRNISKRVEVGVPGPTKLTLKQIFSAINKTTTGALIASVIKDAFIEAVETDPSV